MTIMEEHYSPDSIEPRVQGQWSDSNAFRASEDSDKDREFHAMRASHATALREVEESGYNKGVGDKGGRPPFR